MPALWGVAKDADDELRIVINQLLHCPGAVIDDLQEERPAGGSHSRERARDRVVDVFWDPPGVHGVRLVRIEHLEKMPKLLSLRFEAERLVLLQRLAIAGRIVVERDAVETEIRAEPAFFRRAFDVPTLDVI